jgi:hypothetical protein
MFTVTASSIRPPSTRTVTHFGARRLTKPYSSNIWETASCISVMGASPFRGSCVAVVNGASAVPKGRPPEDDKHRDPYPRAYRGP